MQSGLTVAGSELEKCTREEEYHLEKLIQARRLHNTLVPVSLLPPELLVKIFWLASVGSTSYWDESCMAHGMRLYYPPPSNIICKSDIRGSIFYQLQSLRAVCKQWSDLVLNTGTLWSTVELAFPRTIATTVTRSKGSDLGIYARFKDCPLAGRGYPPIMDAFAEYETKESLHITQLMTSYWQRIVHINLVIESGDLQLMYDSIESSGSSLPHLRTLHLVELNYQPRRGTISPYPTASALQPISCPALEELTFTPILFTSLPVTGMRKLKKLAITARFESWFQMNIILTAVALAKDTLEELTAMNQPFGSIASPDLSSRVKDIDLSEGCINAPRLRSLRLDDIKGSEALRIISAIHAPKAVRELQFSISGITEFLRQCGLDHSIFPDHPYTISLGPMGFQMKSLLPSSSTTPALDEDLTSPLPIRFESPCFLEYTERPYEAIKECIKMLGQLRIDHLTVDPPQHYPLPPEMDHAGMVHLPTLDPDAESTDSQPWWPLLFTSLPHLTSITVNPSDKSSFSRHPSLYQFALALQGLHPGKAIVPPWRFRAPDEESTTSSSLLPCPHLKCITVIMDSDDFLRNMDEHLRWLQPVAQSRSQSPEMKLDQIIIDLNQCNSMTYHLGMLPSDDRVLWNSKPLEEMLRVLQEFAGEVVATRGVMRNVGYGWKSTGMEEEVSFPS